MESNSRAEREVLRAALERSPDCPAVEELAAFAEGGSTAGDERIQAHVRSCPRCGAELRLAAEFRSATAAREEEANVAWIASRLERRFTAPPQHGAQAPPSSSRFWNRLLHGGFLRAVPVAAALCLITAGAVYWRRSQQAPVLQPAGSDLVFRGGRVRTVEPSGTLNDPPTTFRWEAVAGAARYRVTVTEIDGTEVWNSTTAGFAVAAPSEVRQRAVPAKALIWRVTALDGQDRPIGDSGPISFRLAAPRPR